MPRSSQKPNSETSRLKGFCDVWRVGSVSLAGGKRTDCRASWSFAARQVDVEHQALEEGLLTRGECEKGAADVMQGTLAFPG